ncbi:hypothetical protein BLNAU_18870 [Blattamonas nauphoetae]|uniref:Uncharacterized protein n=1 Tax=Blattamonas nauphoetae TaxID=2049346 RepID=A0ABQ9X4G3_9EUKA|nr:hypothetical protein BLNAU_18870 [Blattamonas nauphoetae]
MSFRPSSDSTAVRFLVNGRQGSRILATVTFPDLLPTDPVTKSSSALYQIQSFSSLSSFVLIPVEQLVTLIFSVVSGNNEKNVLEKSASKSFAIHREYVKMKMTITFDFASETHLLIESHSEIPLAKRRWKIEGPLTSLDGVITELEPYRASEITPDDIKLDKLFDRVGSDSAESVTTAIYRHAESQAAWSNVCKKMYERFLTEQQNRENYAKVMTLLKQRAARVGLNFGFVFETHVLYVLNTLATTVVDVMEKESTEESSSALKLVWLEKGREFIQCFHDLLKMGLFDPKLLPKVPPIFLGKIDKSGPTGVHMTMLVQFLLLVPEAWNHIEKSSLRSMMVKMWAATACEELETQFEDMLLQVFTKAQSKGILLTTEEKASDLRQLLDRSDTAIAALKNERVVNHIHLVKSPSVSTPDQCRADFMDLLQTKKGSCQFMTIFVSYCVTSNRFLPVAHYVLTVVGHVTNGKGDTINSIFERRLEEVTRKFCFDRFRTRKESKETSNIQDDLSYFRKYIFPCLSCLEFMIRTDHVTIPFIETILNAVANECLKRGNDLAYVACVQKLLMNSCQRLYWEHRTGYESLMNTLLTISNSPKQMPEIAGMWKQTIKSLTSDDFKRQKLDTELDTVACALLMPLWISPNHSYTLEMKKYLRTPQRVSAQVPFSLPGVQTAPRPDQPNQSINTNKPSAKKASKPPKVEVKGFVSLIEDDKHTRITAGGDSDLVRLMAEALLNSDFDDETDTRQSSKTSSRSSQSYCTNKRCSKCHGPLHTSDPTSMEMGTHVHDDGSEEEYVLMKSFRKLPAISTTPPHISSFKNFCQRKLEVINPEREKTRRDYIDGLFMDHDNLNDTAEDLIEFFDQQADVVRVAEELYIVRVLNDDFKELMVLISKAIEFRTGDRTELCDPEQMEKEFSFVLLLAGSAITQFAEFLKTLFKPSLVKEKKSLADKHVTTLLEMISEGLIPPEFIHELFVSILEGSQDPWKNEVIVSAISRLMSSVGSFVEKEDHEMIQVIVEFLKHAEATPSLPDPLRRDVNSVLTMISRSSYPPFTPAPSLSRLLNPNIYHPNEYTEDGETHAIVFIPNAHPDVSAFLTILAISPSKPDFDTRHQRLAPFMSKTACLSVAAEVLFKQAVEVSAFRMQFEHHLSELTFLSGQCKTTPFNQIVADMAIRQLVGEMCGNRDSDFNENSLSEDDWYFRVENAEEFAMYLCDLLSHGLLPASNMRILVTQLMDECTPRKPNDITLQILCFVLSRLETALHTTLLDIVESVVNRLEKILNGGKAKKSTVYALKDTLRDIIEGSYLFTEKDRQERAYLNDSSSDDEDTTECEQVAREWKEKEDRKRREEEERRRKEEEKQKQEAKKKKEEEAKRKKEEAEKKKQEEKRKQEEEKRKKAEKKKRQKEEKLRQQALEEERLKEKEDEERRREEEEARIEAARLAEEEEMRQAFLKREKKRKEREEKARKEQMEEEKRIQEELEAQRQREKEKEEREDKLRRAREEENRIKEEERQREEEERQREEEERQREEEERQREEEERQREEEERQREEEERQREEEERQREEEERQREEEERQREEEERQREEEERQREEEERQREEEERQREEEERQREEEERKKEEATRRIEMEEQIRKQVEEQLRAEYEAKWKAEQEELARQKQTKERAKSLVEEENESHVDPKVNKVGTDHILQSGNQTSSDSNEERQIQRTWTPQTRTQDSWKPQTGSPEVKGGRRRDEGEEREGSRETARKEKMRQVEQQLLEQERELERRRNERLKENEEEERRIEAESKAKEDELEKIRLDFEKEMAARRRMRQANLSVQI